MLEICIQTSYDQNVQLILKSYLPVVYGTSLNPRYALLIFEGKLESEIDKSRDTGNIGYKTQNKETKNTTQKTTKMSNAYLHFR
jgi:hypothetical protein